MKRNKFSLSHYKLLTLDMGLLIPITWYEVLPGDTIQQSTASLIRCSPLLSPVMHPVNVRIHHWFAPNRLLWDDWEDFITGGSDGNNASVHPYMDFASVAEGSIFDYFGIPPGTYSPDLRASALPLRAYNLIYNQHYRDQDLVSELTIDTTDGEDTTSDTDIQHVAWEKDYFTTARPWEQKGDEVTVPLGSKAPVKGIGVYDQNYPVSSAGVYETGESSSTTFADARRISDLASNEYTYIENDVDNSGYPGIYADLTEASGISINDLRLALAIQRYQEARAQYGSRYTEYLRYLGIRSSDGRLQNPEYLGGGRQTISFSEVLTTAEVGSHGVGEMYGHGISAMRTNRFRRFFEEHGIVMTLMSIIPKSIYTQGLHRRFSREVKEDYFQKELMYLGEQAILNKETYTEHSAPDDTFGYQSRYDEYRNMPSNISGEFHSTLNHWHYGRIFSSDTALNQTFIEATPTKRVNASTGTDCLYVMTNHSIQARRMLTKYAKSRTF